MRREIRAVDPTQFVDGVLHPSGSAEYWPNVDRLEDADGVRFLCPKCYQANGVPLGTHSVICWFEDRVTDDAQPGPGRWKPTGTGIEDLTFVVGKRSNSVLLLGGCKWHGFITNGDAT
jgi:hypothetical protein